MTRVLYITYNGLTSHIGQSQVLPYVQGLGRLGHEICVLSFEADDDLARLGGSVKVALQDSNVTWHTRRFHSRPPLLAKLIDQHDARRTARELFGRSGFDVIHCRSYVAADVGIGLKRRFGAKLLFDMRGFWVEERVEGGRWPQNNPLYRFIYWRWKAKEAKMISTSDEIVVLADAAQHALTLMPSYKNAPVSVIPCSLDFERFPLPTVENRIKARQELAVDPEGTVLVYLGSLGTIYLFEEMVLFFQELKRRRKASVFLLIGNHHPDRILQQARQVAPELESQDFRFKHVRHFEVAYWLGAGDIGIGFRAPTFSSKGASPTKLGEYLAVGLPVVCNDGVGDVKQIVEDLDAGYVVSDFSPQSLSNAVKRIGERKRQPREAIRERARKLFDMNSAVRAYDQIYSRMAP